VKTTCSVSSASSGSISHQDLDAGTKDCPEVDPCGGQPGSEKVFFTLIDQIQNCRAAYTENLDHVIDGV
jgi:hypothetical protein